MRLPRLGAERQGDAREGPDRRATQAPESPEPASAPDLKELALVARAFESDRSLFQLLSTLRTRRVGLGYRMETGEEEEFAWSSGRTVTQTEGPLRHVSLAEPVPLSEVEEALLCWAAVGPNGIALADVPVHGGLAGLLSWAGRTVPSSSNDLAVDLFVVNDDGVWIYRPSTERAAPVEIRGPADYAKVLAWYRQGRTSLSERRPDVAWPSSPPGTHNVNPTGPGQYNLNRPGSTWLLPVGDVGLEWFNQLLVSYEWSGFYLLDPDTDKPAGCEQWIRPGFLEVGFPIPVFDETVLLLHMGQVGCIVQNLRLACEALGLGAWTTGSYADDLVLGAYPEVAKGLGFDFLERDPSTNPSRTATCLGLPGVKDAVVVPSSRFPDAASAVRYVKELRYRRGAQLARQDNWSTRSGGPYRPDVLEEILQHPRTYVAEWAEEAAIATVEHIVAKHGCCPAYINPVRAKLSVQVHHVDPAFYRTFGVGDGEPYALTPAIVEHFGTWHPGLSDPARAAESGTPPRSEV
jgi:hypothetical protein